jgi:hypothetical protein
MSKIKETYILAPTKIVAKAKELYKKGLYEQALDLLENNCVVADVYPTKVEMRTAKELKNKGRSINADL